MPDPVVHPNSDGVWLRVFCVGICGFAVVGFVFRLRFLCNHELVDDDSCAPAYFLPVF